MTRRGQTLLVAVLLLAVALALLPAVVFYAQSEGLWSVKQARSSQAYQLAEAGQDRAVAFLARSDADWSTAATSAAPAGYAGEVQYSDVAGGLYTIRISSGPGFGQITVLTKGRDTSAKEIRSIKAVYINGGGDAASGPLVSGFVAASDVTLSPNVAVYWGQLTSYSNLILDTSYPYHPLKLARGSVSPLDTDPTPPNSDPTKGYTAYDKTLVEPPTLDFDYYRQVAQASLVTPPGSGAGNNGSQSPAWRGTGYFDAGATVQQVDFKNYTLVCSTCVVFVEGDNVMLEGSGYMHVGALIVRNGNIHIHSTGANPYVVSVPTDAWKQYVAGTVTNPHGGDTAALDEYPGDGGYHTTKATYSVPTAAFDGASSGMAFHGLLYAYSFNCPGHYNSIVGQFLVGPGGTNVNTMSIYFDPAVASATRFAGGQVIRASWAEVLSAWP